MPKRYRYPRLVLLEEVDEDVITASPETGDNDVEDPWGDLETDF